jgi:hypothetical protein
MVLQDVRTSNSMFLLYTKPVTRRDLLSMGRHLTLIPHLPMPLDDCQRYLQNTPRAVRIALFLKSIAGIAPGNFRMSESKVIANQKTILQNQKAILSNQKIIQANQVTIKKNQAAILKNQAALQTIVENQKKILAKLK